MPIDPRQFLSEAEELHALVIGLCEVIAFWPPFFKNLTSDQKADLVQEYHYYMLGRALGIFVWLAICCGVKAVFF